MRKRISVRQLVEFILKKGSINQRYATSEHTALEGSRIHRLLQKEMEKEYGDSYQSEVSMKQIVVMNAQEVLVDGRADGIIQFENGKVTIDEIKTSEPAFENVLPEQVDLYWYQVMVYGYFYCLDNELEEITLQLTYYQTTEEKITREQKIFSYLELESFFSDLIGKYEAWLVFQENWRMLRNETIQQLEFPFDSYRKGQRELSVAVYNTIRQSKKLYVEAPTGTGKTISTLFPTVKAMGEKFDGEPIERIFYLTAKTITRQVVEDGFQALQTKRLKMKAVTLTSKDKICFLEERICTPEACPFANGYYNRINEALWDLLNNEDQMTRSVIESYARKHTVCPFELSLDVSLWCDLVICDYNYLFDPRVYLRRFFEDEDKSNVFLVDEAHNLVDRSRSMYSATLSKEKIMRLKHTVKGEEKLVKHLEKINQEFLKLKRVMEEEDVTFMSQHSEVSSIIAPINRFNEFAREWLAQNQEHEEQKEVLDFYFDCLAYLRISEYYDDHFMTYMEITYSDVLLKQFCMDPSYVLNQTFQKGCGAVLFSASLTPLFYYQQVLGGEENDFRYLVESPFDKENQQVIIDRSIQTTYRNRERSIEPIVERLTTFIQAKQGNYLFFFPSYKYLDDVYVEFALINKKVKILVQDTIMTEEEREKFLAQFEENAAQTTVGFCVLGGIFSEGIDLKGTRLIGTAIVSVGLPQLNQETELLKKYFDETLNAGFSYAYQIPGMNKVIQAAGRVIRTSQDKGVVLLLDERFARKDYQQYFPLHWYPHTVVYNSTQLSEVLETFW
ncbi:MAG: ATP-dependent DNA helicase [Lactobacillales bacterium]|jgi:Rad3-related DNA helicase|nr:ATP-dependent DNA helicase [Lactobacillales bacterium]